ncbi:hypothetical protein BD324DRAFT_616743 [Kockovaella imperatae]|uniref:Uncharacterized protein n=1 Tax=Kockovaella imperatae TaxID=4999 RepID=A0A1Y1URX5_9TREE|nr:hypothetical protein BD324DRAFT_616743 [Kockovaella imperatae]ORX40196.1 hypothetical protein BD324DRAFT_616743 [Kockovaella imperatae]
MVRSHARNNTTQANLTYYERSLLRQPNAAKRIGGESFKPLDSCNLCLSTVTDPVACGKGHVYCRECAIGNLISQKAGIEVQKRELERLALLEEKEREEARAKARARVVADFERGMGLGVGANAIGSGIGSSSNKTNDGVKAGTTGRFTFNQSAMEDASLKAEEKALAKIEAELAESRKAKLPAYWLPSMAPEAKAPALKDIKLQTVCQVGKDGPHPMARKTLLPVILTYPPASTSKPICPSCTKELSNSTSSILLKSTLPPASSASVALDSHQEDGPKKKKSKKEKGKEEQVCGHVICKTCADTIVKPTRRCPVCEATIGSADMVPLGKEGTGFAAAGGAEVKKDTVVFRV